MRLGGRRGRLLSAVGRYGRAGLGCRLLGGFLGFVRLTSVIKQIRGERAAYFGIEM